jgi:DNA polymerase-1
VIRRLIPSDLRKEIRWNNIINCRPPENRDPEKIEIEACRSRIERDIQETKPKAIFGLGSVPLNWAANSPGKITDWRGRRFPIKVGDHTCWYFSFLHPSALLHWRKQMNGREYPSEQEFAFEKDIERAFKQVKDGLPEPVVHTEQYARSNITCITGKNGEKELAYVLDFLEHAGEVESVGVDYETQNLRPYRKSSKILTAAVSTKDESLAFAYRHPQAGWTEDQLEQITKAWKKFLLSKSRKVSHNLSFEAEWSVYFFGKEMAWHPSWVDTQTQAYVLDERTEDKETLSLAFLTQQYFGLDIKELTKGLKKNNMGAEPLDAILPYNGIDAKYHRLLDEEQTKKIKEESLWDVYLEKEEQVPSVVLAQIKGLPIDQDVNKQLLEEYEGKIREVLNRVEKLPESKQFRKITGEKFNPGSNQHTVVILKDILKTRTGQPGAGWSTTESVLNEVNHPLTLAVVEYRKVVKLKSTYVDPYSEGSDTLYDDGLVHTSLGTTFTVTGRLNSDSPNVQNIVVRSSEGRKVRKQFRPFNKKGVIVAFDYGQIDARCIACGSKDKAYCKALWEDFDIHMDWAERLAYEFPQLVGGKKNLKDKKALEKLRSTKVKNEWVFALFYGAGLGTTARRFGIDENLLRSSYKEFWDIFSGVKDWQGEVEKQYNKVGYVQLFDGLRRRAPIGHGQRINCGIQGATQRIVMNSMNALSKLSVEDWSLQPNLQIHDELLYFFEDERQFEDVAPRIIQAMLDQSKFDWIVVPISIELKMSYTDWSEMEKIDTFFSHKELGWPRRSKEFE